LCARAIIGSFGSDGHIVRMAFGHTGVGDTCELCLVKRLDVGSSAVSHAGTEAANHLVNYLVEVAFEGYTCGNAFGNEFLYIGLVALEVTVFRAFLHRFE